MEFLSLYSTIGDGYCDPMFNSFIYGFDDGDCCDQKYEDWNKRCGGDEECDCFYENNCNFTDLENQCKNETLVKFCNHDCGILDDEIPFVWTMLLTHATF